MTNLISRDYNCKDEELPVIGNFVSFSFRRDLADFTAFSPKFDLEYTSDFDSKIAQAEEVIAPESETLELKTLTENLNSAMDGLIDPINRVNGYLQLAQPTLSMNAAGFGLTNLRAGITKKDAESVLNNLHTVSQNLLKYKTQLATQGLSDELCNRFTTAAAVIAETKQARYEIIVRRKNIVQDNVILFNSLFAQLSEILKVGKILYKASNAVKTEEYTFDELKKQVRHSQAPSVNPAHSNGETKA